MPAYYLEALVVFLGILLLIAEAFVPSKNKSWVGLSAAAGLTFILILAFLAVGPQDRPDKDWASWPLWNFYQFDAVARFFKIFSLTATILVLLMAVDFRGLLARFTDHPGSEESTGEYYPLMVFACAGMMWLASANNLAGAFVAVELVTISFYVLVAYLRRNIGSLEAGVKYVILGALSTAFLVYGIAWVFGSTGTMMLSDMPEALSAMENTRPLLFGIALVLVGIGFKVGAVPMQGWIPDVYQGAPTPTTAFLSVGSKAAGFIFLIRFLEPFLAEGSPVRGQLITLLAILAGATLLLGNLAAIPQTNFKRLLGYSSIAHAGFLLMAVAAWRPQGEGVLGSPQVVAFYLATYLVMTLGVFFILAQVRIQRDGEEVSHFNGLAKTNPHLAFGLTVLMAALAGLPLTAGFIGKFLVFSLAVQAGLWPLIGIAFIGVGAGFYYYLKLVRAMWWVDPAPDAAPVELPAFSRAAVVTLVALTLILGVFFQPILNLL